MREMDPFVLPSEVQSGSRARTDLWVSRSRDCAPAGSGVRASRRILREDHGCHVSGEGREGREIEAVRQRVPVESGSEQARTVDDAPPAYEGH